MRGQFASIQAANDVIHNDRLGKKLKCKTYVDPERVFSEVFVLDVIKVD